MSPSEFLRKYRIVMEIFNTRKAVEGKFYANLLLMSFVSFLFYRKESVEIRDCNIMLRVTGTITHRCF